MALLKPNLFIDRITELDISALRETGIRGIVLDVDNTLVPHNHPLPDETARRVIEHMRQQGMKLIVLSNNHPERVAPFCDAMGLPYISDAGKPLGKNYRKAMAQMETNPQSTAAVGDQFFTDVLGGNRAGLFTVLVRPISEANETRWIEWKRKIEKMLYRHYGW